MNNLNKIDNSKLLEIHKIIKDYIKELNERQNKGES